MIIASCQTRHRRGSLSIKQTKNLSTAPYIITCLFWEQYHHHHLFCFEQHTSSHVLFPPNVVYRNTTQHTCDRTLSLTLQLLPFLSRLHHRPLVDIRNEQYTPFIAKYNQLCLSQWLAASAQLSIMHPTAIASLSLMWSMIPCSMLALTIYSSS
jgi:hypothetical protein